MINIIYWQSVRSDIFRNVEYNEFLVIIGKKFRKLNQKTIDYLNSIVHHFNSSENEYKNYLNIQVNHYDDIVENVQDSMTNREFDNLIFNVSRKRFKRFCPRKERNVFLNKLMNGVYYE